MKPKRQQGVTSAKNVLLVLLLACAWLLTDGSASAGESMPRRGPVGAWDRGEHEPAHVSTWPKEVPSITAGGMSGQALMAEEPATQPGSNAPVPSPDTAGGAVRGWGYNKDGQVSAPAGLTAVTAIAGGGSHSLALRNDGTIAAWGFYPSIVGERLSPSVSLRDVAAIAAGGSHSLALMGDGTVIAWGDNSRRCRDVPPGLTGVTAIAAGWAHNLALKNDGTVVAWGDNDDRQCSVPPGLTGVTAVAAGASHSLALKSDGTVVAWGADDRGQSTVPPGLTGVTAIAAGGAHSLVVIGRPVSRTADLPRARATLANAQRRLNAITEEYKGRYSLHVIDRIDLAANRLTIHYSRYLVRKRGEEFDPNKKTRLFITDHWTYYVDLASIDSINLSPMVGRPDEECYLHIGAVADAITHDRTQYKKDGNVYYQGPSVRAYRGFNISLGFAEEGKALNVVLNDVLQAFRLVYPQWQ